MNSIKLFDSELKLMEIIWANEPIEAKEICRLATQSISWNKNTTYTILNKLVAKQAVARSEPNFLCASLIDKEHIQSTETLSLINRLYNGSKKSFFASFLKDENLTREEIAELRSMIDRKGSS